MKTINNTLTYLPTVKRRVEMKRVHSITFLSSKGRGERRGMKGVNGFTLITTE